MRALQPERLFYDDRAVMLLECLAQLCPDGDLLSSIRSTSSESPAKRLKSFRNVCYHAVEEGLAASTPPVQGVHALLVALKATAHPPSRSQENEVMSKLNDLLNAWFCASSWVVYDSNSRWTGTVQFLRSGDLRWRASNATSFGPPQGHWCINVGITMLEYWMHVVLRQENSNLAGGALLHTFHDWA